MIKSPCIDVCRMEGARCAGCLRTLDEIVRWRDMSDAEREAVLCALASRPRALAEETRPHD